MRVVDDICAEDLGIPAHYWFAADDVLTLHAILNYFQPQNTMSEAEGIAISILNNVLNDLMKNISEMSFDIVNEIVNSLFENAQKPSAHSCSCVSNTKKSKNGIRSFFGWL